VEFASIILGHTVIILLIFALIRLVYLEGRFQDYNFTDTEAINSKISEKDRYIYTVTQNSTE
jgi:hypothetical protein